MLDPQLLRRDPEKTAELLKSRGFVLDVHQIRLWEEQRKALQTRQQELQQQRNQDSKTVGKLKTKGEDASSLISDLDKLGTELARIEQELQQKSI